LTVIVAEHRLKPDIITLAVIVAVLGATPPVIVVPYGLVISDAGETLALLLFEDVKVAFETVPF